MTSWVVLKYLTLSFGARMAGVCIAGVFFMAALVAVTSAPTSRPAIADALPEKTFIPTETLFQPETFSAADTTCASGAPADFDFWLGTWTLTWEGGRGTNRIRRILGGCVIEEQFTGHMGDGSVYRGRSYTVYDASDEVWRQTWVDDRGGYLEFTQPDSTEMLPQDHMVLARTKESEKGVQHFRMVWRDVRADRLTWHWQRRSSPDTTWKTLWSIRYEKASADQMIGGSEE